MHDFLLDRIDIQLFLDFLAAPFRFDYLVSERRRCAVPEILFGVFQHGTGDILPFSLDVYSSKIPMICRIISCDGSVPVGCVVEMTSTPCLRSFRMVNSMTAPSR